MVCNRPSLTPINNFTNGWVVELFVIHSHMLCIFVGIYRKKMMLVNSLVIVVVSISFLNWSESRDVSRKRFDHLSLLDDKTDKNYVKHPEYLSKDKKEGSNYHLKLAESDSSNTVTDSYLLEEFTMDAVDDSDYVKESIDSGPSEDVIPFEPLKHNEISKYYYTENMYRLKIPKYTDKNDDDYSEKSDNSGHNYVGVLEDGSGSGSDTDDEESSGYFRSDDSDDQKMIVIENVEKIFLV